MTQSYIVCAMKDEKYLSNLVGAFATSVASGIEQRISELGARSLSAEVALVAIYNHPDETIDVLSKVLAITHSGVVRLINTLELEGLVERLKSIRDGRAVVLRVTQSGRERVKVILKARESATTKFLDNFDSEQKKNLLVLLEIAMGKVTDDQLQARRVCRLCNEGVCRQQGCPVELAVK